MHVTEFIGTIACSLILDLPTSAIMKLMVVVVIITCLLASIAPLLGGTLIPEWVLRRQSGDIFNYVNSEDNTSHIHCDNTYLVDDKRCVMDQELFEGKVKRQSSLAYKIL